MIPLEKVQDIIVKHDSLEKDLSSNSVDPKIFAQKSKEYSSLSIEDFLIISVSQAVAAIPLI